MIFVISVHYNTPYLALIQAKLLQRQREDLRFVVVDNGSGSACALAYRDLLDKGVVHGLLRYEFSKNRGVTPGHNHGMALDAAFAGRNFAEYDHILLLDSDSFPVGCLSLAVKELENTAITGIVWSVRNKPQLRYISPAFWMSSVSTFQELQHVSWLRVVDGNTFYDTGYNKTSAALAKGLPVTFTPSACEVDHVNMLTRITHSPPKAIHLPFIDSTIAKFSKWYNDFRDDLVELSMGNCLEYVKHCSRLCRSNSTVTTYIQPEYVPGKEYK